MKLIMTSQSLGEYRAEAQGTLTNDKRNRREALLDVICGVTERPIIRILVLRTCGMEDRLSELQNENDTS
jgi:hypothetical protein